MCDGKMVTRCTDIISKTFLTFMVFDILRVKLCDARTPFFTNFLNCKNMFNTSMFSKKYNVPHKGTNKRTKVKVKKSNISGVIWITLL